MSYKHTEMEIINDETFLGSLSKYKLVPKITICENNTEIFCLRFSLDGKYLAAGCGDGSVKVFNSYTGSLTYDLQHGSNIALPTTSIRFRPISDVSTTKNILISSNACGSVNHWHMTSSKCLNSINDTNNPVYALDFNETGSQFATAGKDRYIRIYDETTKSLIQSLGQVSGYLDVQSNSHSNRVFSIKFVPNSSICGDNLILSAGWDNTVQIWDIRSNCTVRSIYGPHICGDSIDIVGHELLTGSWRNENQLEIWDFGSGKKISDINWNQKSKDSSQSSCLLYAAQFSKEGTGKFIAAGGSGSNEAKVYDHSCNNQLIGTITGLQKGIFTTDFSPDSQRFVIGGGDESIRIFDIVSVHE